jgi:aspartate 1-decarboxylase
VTFVPASPDPRLHFRRLLKSKIHRLAVTETNLAYEGSLTLDTALMARADLLPWEAVDIANINTGARFTTYVIEGTTGECCLNGAAARLGEVGDLLIIMAFDLVADEVARGFQPKIVHPDQVESSAPYGGRSRA